MKQKENWPTKQSSGAGKGADGPTADWDSQELSFSDSRGR